MAKCIPGMPCYSTDVIVYTTYPPGCRTTTPSAFTLPLPSDDLYYSGPNLPNSGINYADTLTVALQKIDELLPSSVNVVTPTAPDRTITIVIDGVTYYIHAKITND